MTRPRLDVVAECLEDVLRHQRDTWGLHPDRLSVGYVENPGGFVNSSFAARDGDSALHIKLATPEDQARLHTWMSHGSHLSSNYHAPVVRGWIDLPEKNLAGLVFDFLEGVVPTSWDVVNIDELSETIVRLHGDDTLADALGSATTAQLAYVESFDRRFRADLAEIEPTPPPFLTHSVLSFLRHEVDTVGEMVRTSAAFQEPASAPIHGDIWLNNLLVQGGHWYLLDWDGLTIGDPAMDAAMIGGPQFQDDGWLLCSQFDHHEPAFHERVQIYHRAMLLDWCIDVLADYVEAPHWLDDATAFRADKAQVHQRALRTYRTRYA